MARKNFSGSRRNAPKKRDLGNGGTGVMLTENDVDALHDAFDATGNEDLGDVLDRVCDDPECHDTLDEDDQETAGD